MAPLSQVMETFCESAKRAMCTLPRKINNLQAGNIKILLDLFDGMVLPICTCDGKVSETPFFTN